MSGCTPMLMEIPGCVIPTTAARLNLLGCKGISQSLPSFEMT